MIELGGRSLLDWQLAALRAAGVRQIAVVRGYLGESLTARADALFDNPRWAETNMVASLACASSWLEETPCVVSYADIVYHPAAVGALLQAEGDLAITYDRRWLELWAERFADPLADAETFRLNGGHAVAEIGNRPRALGEVQGQYMGLLRFTPASWAKARASLERLSPEQRDKLDMTGLLKRLLAESVRVTGATVDGRWCEVDSENDLRLYEAKLASGQPWAHDWRWETPECGVRSAEPWNCGVRSAECGVSDSSDSSDQPGLVVWITGLSGAGKSCIARELVRLLRRGGAAPILLDGDEVRAAISDPQVNHDRASRLTNAMRICRLAKLLAGQGFTVVAATMSLFREVHDWNREHLPAYFEVYVRVRWDVLQQRDARGIYSRALAGAVNHVVGVHLDYDEPASPDLVLENDEPAASLEPLAREIAGRLPGRVAGRRPAAADRNSAPPP